MLIVTRKPGDRIVIDGRIDVVVLKVKGKHVSIGIKAPKEVPIERGEVVARAGA